MYYTICRLTNCSFPVDRGTLTSGVGMCPPRTEPLLLLPPHTVVLSLIAITCQSSCEKTTCLSPPRHMRHAKLCVVNLGVDRKHAKFLAYSDTLHIPAGRGHNRLARIQMPCKVKSRCHVLLFRPTLVLVFLQYSTLPFFFLLNLPRTEKLTLCSTIHDLQGLAT